MTSRLSHPVPDSMINPAAPPLADERGGASNRLKILSDYTPAGDQPQAIIELTGGLVQGDRDLSCWASPARARPSRWRMSCRTCSARR
jgi:hypothetical protein